MEIKVGVRDSAGRDVVINTEQSLEDIQTALQEALDRNGTFTVEGARNRKVIFVASAVTHIDVAHESGRTVGFGFSD